MKKIIILVAVSFCSGKLMAQNAAAVTPVQNPKLAPATAPVMAAQAIVDADLKPVVATLAPKAATKKEANEKNSDVNTKEAIVAPVEKATAQPALKTAPVKE